MVELRNKKRYDEVEEGLSYQPEKKKSENGREGGDEESSEEGRGEAPPKTKEKVSICSSFL